MTTANTKTKRIELQKQLIESFLNYENAELIEFNNIKIVKYSKNDQLLMIGFKGTSTKSYFHYRYRSEERRTEDLNRYLKYEQENIEHKEKAKKEAAEFKNQLKVDTILYSSWGYEQTNVDFYQVVSTTEKTVILQEIGSKIVRTDEHGFSGSVIADPTIKTGEPFRSLVKQGKYCNVKCHTVGHVWDGKSVSYSSWH